MKEIFESKGETGFCKSTLEPCDNEQNCNVYHYIDIDEVQEDGVCDSANGFGVIYLKGTHKYEYLYKELNSASFRFKGMFTLRGIKNSKLTKATSMLARWMPGQVPLFSFGEGDDLDCDSNNINVKLMIGLAIKYNLNVEEFLHVYWYIGNSLPLSPLKNSDVIDAFDYEEHKSNAFLFNQHQRRKNLAENACLQASVERANKRRKEDTFKAAQLQL